MSHRIRMYDYLPSVFIRCRQLSRAIVVSHKKKAPVNHRGNHKNRVGIYGAHLSFHCAEEDRGDAGKLCKDVLLSGQEGGKRKPP